MSIAYKEARKTNYWLRLLTDSEYLKNNESKSLIEDSEELLRILGSIKKSLSD